METKQEYYNYSNFKCYNKKGQRYAIFGQLFGDKLEITQIKCSKQDQFSKNYAKTAYHLYHTSKIGNFEFHPEVLELEIKNDKPLWVFNQYCKENFYHKREQLKKYKEVVLVKTNEKSVILSHKRLFKMDTTY